MWDILQGIRLRDILDILIVAFLLYRIFLVLRGTLAVQMLAGLAILIGARFVAREADLYSIGFILDNFWTFWVLALIVLFQPELRRTLAQVGEGRALRRLLGESVGARGLVVDAVAAAAGSLVSKRLGALIVIERTGGLSQYAELGVALDARVSAELLESIFLPTSPLHDGAVLVRDDRVAAAACFLPLSRNLQLARTLGTRHRAALGLSEETDAVVVVASEETGMMSVAVEGHIESGFDPTTLARRLAELLGTGEPESRGVSLLEGVRRLTARGKA